MLKSGRFSSSSFQTVVMLVLMGRKRESKKNRENRRKNDLKNCIIVTRKSFFNGDDKRTFIASLLPFEFKTLNMVCRRNCMTNDLPMFKVSRTVFCVVNAAAATVVVFISHSLALALDCRSFYRPKKSLHFDLFPLHMTTQNVNLSIYYAIFNQKDHWNLTFFVFAIFYILCLAHFLSSSLLRMNFIVHEM